MIRFGCARVLQKHQVEYQLMERRTLKRRTIKRHKINRRLMLKSRRCRHQLLER